MRLNQYIAHCTKYSRREADWLIQQGRVNIEKSKATTHSILKNNERVFIDGRRIFPKVRYTCIVYHKPKGEIVSNCDDRGRKIIYDNLSAEFKHFSYVGRLDFASEGLLILTDSKNIARVLMESTLPRTYIVKIQGMITKDIIEAMKNGLESIPAHSGAHPKSDIKTMSFKPFGSYKILKNNKNFSKLKLSITEGQNRELRRFFGVFNKDVLDLRRISFGFISLNALPIGKSRYFTPQEYRKLRDFISKNT